MCVLVESKKISANCWAFNCLIKKTVPWLFTVAVPSNFNNSSETFSHWHLTTVLLQHKVSISLDTVKTTAHHLRRQCRSINVSKPLFPAEIFFFLKNSVRLPLKIAYPRRFHACAFKENVSFTLCEKEHTCSKVVGLGKPISACRLHGKVGWRVFIDGVQTEATGPESTHTRQCMSHSGEHPLSNITCVCMYTLHSLCLCVCIL